MTDPTRPSGAPTDVLELQGEPEGITRRALLRDGSLVSVAVLAAGATQAFGNVAVGLRADGPAFLTPGELRTLRALVDVFVPADDLGGAAEAGCAEAIDALLGAFRTDPPRIWAGAPFSDRGGSPVNHFERFLSLDRYERRAWRIRIEGTKGLKRLEWAGPVKGWQATYRDGLAALDRAAGGDGFASRPAPERELLVRTSGEAAITALVDVAFPHTVEFLYGAPEYGGNRDGLGWRITSFDGDVLPRGYTRAEIEQPGPGGEATPPLPPELAAVLGTIGGMAALAGSSELAHGMVVRGGGSLRGLRAELGALEGMLEEGRRGA